MPTLLRATLAVLLVLPALALAQPGGPPGLPAPPPQLPGTPPPGTPPAFPGTPPQVPGTPPPGTPPTLPGTPPQVPTVLAVRVNPRVVLQGPRSPALNGGALMRSDLAAVIPLSQPYASAPWNHAGGEVLRDSDANLVPDIAASHDIVDWVLVCLRVEAFAPDLGCRAATLRADGALLDPATEQVGVRLAGRAPGLYYVVVRHRTHLAVMTAAPIQLDDASPGAFVNLTQESGVYGSNGVVATPGAVWAMIAGDGDGDGFVLAPDRQAVWLPQVGQTGYLAGDFNLDGNVLADDRQAMWAPNVGRQSTVPGGTSRFRSQ